MRVDVDVAGVQLWIDGKNQGALSREAVAIALGSHSIVLRKVGYRDYEHRLEVFAGGPATLHVRARMMPLETPIFATVYQQSTRLLRRREFAERRQGLRQLQEAAEGGWPAAQEALGALYASGLRSLLEPNDALALQWNRRAAQAGAAGARYALGRRLELGFWENAGGGGGVTCKLLGLLCGEDTDTGSELDPETDFEAWLLSQSPGRGTARELAEAFELHLGLAHENTPQAQERVGFMLMAGHGAPANRYAGFLWLRSAALLGRRDAQLALGKLYATGYAYRPDPQAAACWLRKAASEDPRALRALQAMKLAEPDKPLAPEPQRCDFPPSESPGGR